MGRACFMLDRAEKHETRSCHLVATPRRYSRIMAPCGQRESNPLSLVGNETCYQNTLAASCALRDSNPHDQFGKLAC